jgi:hypothetical protein
MPIWNMLDSYLRDRRNVKIREQQAAAEAAAREEAERPAYTPEELEEIRQLWSEPIEEKDIDGKTVSSSFERFVDSHKPEQLKPFVFHFLKQGFDLPAARARQLAEIAVQNKNLLKGGFYGTDLRELVAARLNTQKKGPERNVTAVVLSSPRRYSTIFFEHFYRRPPGGQPFLTTEEWERGQRPPRRPPTPTT